VVWNRYAATVKRNRLNNGLNVCIHDTTGWGRLSNRFDNRLYRVNGGLEITLPVVSCVIDNAGRQQAPPGEPKHHVSARSQAGSVQGKLAVQRSRWAMK